MEISGNIGGYFW